MEVIFFVCLGILFYIYLAYFALLTVFRSLISPNPPAPGGDARPLSVVIAAYNEEQHIGRRIENLLACEYPKDRLEILVASDGSTDDTVKNARNYAGSMVRVLDFPHSRGRALIHNDAVAAAAGQVIVFTDAETEFEEDTLKRLGGWFTDVEVGLVVGNLIYRRRDTSISRSEGIYWRLEKKMRRLESDLGLLATATGAVMAVRKELWRKLTPIDDCDFTTPLDVILQGRRVIFDEQALAYDVPPSSLTGEIRTRIRQTSKNLAGTLKRWGIRGWRRFPVLSLGLFSHKLLRWFTMYFMLGAFISNSFLAGMAWPYSFLLWLQVGFYGLGVLGLLGELVGRPLPVASTVCAFCAAILGMGVGAIKGIIGRNQPVYAKSDGPGRGPS